MEWNRQRTGKDDFTYSIVDDNGQSICEVYATNNEQDLKNATLIHFAPIMKSELQRICSVLEKQFKYTSKNTLDTDLVNIYIDCNNILKSL